MNNEDFEKQLSPVPFKQIPAGWRRDILEAAEAARRPAASPREDSAHRAGLFWWKAWLWPRPLAWGSLAFVWLLILGANLGTRGSDSGTLQGQTVAHAPHTTTLSEQRALLSQLLDSSRPLAGPMEATPSRRRSDRRLEDLAA
ncbi:MAG TPA: hypothetical protein VFE51_21595 [Verrucomicrobiae bacterium]|nr:hypothetical protein [Verrucomicrobiae bacterium]